MIRKTAYGFTLLELIVVMAILGVLATFTVVQFVGPQKSSRDTRRESDLRQYQTALEIYANKNSGLYPISDLPTNLVDVCTSDLNVDSCVDDPQAPNATSYQYATNATGQIYVLWAYLEKTDEIFIVCSTGGVGKRVDTYTPTGNTCPI